MNNILILQNEIENTIDRLVSGLKATDDEKIIALQLALNTAYKVKNARNAYAVKMSTSEVDGKESDVDGNTNEER